MITSIVSKRTKLTFHVVSSNFIIFFNWKLLLASGTIWMLQILLNYTKAITSRFTG